MRVAIVEDDSSAAGTLKAFLEQYAVETRTGFQISEYSSGDAFLAGNESFELVFMDIDMPGADGMTTARRLRASGRDAALIFATNMAEYAIEGYSVAAAEYMLKPLEYGLFKRKLARVLQTIYDKKPKTVVLELPNGVMQLTVADLSYIEVTGHRAVIHTAQGSIELRKPIGELEKLLSPYDFMRCNQCYLVNPAHVTAIRDGFVFIGGERLAISRNRKKNFMAAFAGWAGKHHA